MNEMRSPIDAEYFSLIKSFLRTEIGADAFVERYFAIWSRERDMEDSARSSWTRRFDLELIEQLNNKLISKEEFSRRWATLFGLTGTRAIIEEMKGAIFTACDVYSPEPIGEFEIGAEALRSEVATHYKAIRDAV